MLGLQGHPRPWATPAEWSATHPCDGGVGWGRDPSKGGCAGVSSPPPLPSGAEETFGSKLIGAKENFALAEGAEENLAKSFQGLGGGGLGDHPPPPSPHPQWCRVVKTSPWGGAEEEEMDKRVQYGFIQRITLPARGTPGGGAPGVVPGAPLCVCECWRKHWCW